MTSSALAFPFAPPVERPTSERRGRAASLTRRSDCRMFELGDYDYDSYRDAILPASTDARPPALSPALSIALARTPLLLPRRHGIHPEHARRLQCAASARSLAPGA